MKYLLSRLCILIFMLFASNFYAQQNHSVNGENYSLKTDVEGSITLLWNTIDGEYRYFIKKEKAITELKNTKFNGKYQQEYKEVLGSQTADADISADKVYLNLPSLNAFFSEYNKLRDPNFVQEKKSIGLKFRLGAFAGFSNSVYTENPNNDTQALAGIDFEILDPIKLMRHAIVFQFFERRTCAHKFGGKSNFV